jgi:effector-binding domain-containing protein
MRKRNLYIISLIAIVVSIAVILGLFSGTIMSQVESLHYQVKKSAPPIEIREYPGLLVAQTEVTGERELAINQGFRIIADFIFGNNVAKQNIAMTAPVIQQSNEKIAMTAPVLQQGDKEQWKVKFVMPSQYTKQTLPVPVNKNIQIIEQPVATFIAITFSGFSTKTNLEKNLKRLQKYIAEHQIQVKGSPIYAFYNPPWTLPFMRRNEIWIEIEPLSYSK